MSNNKKQTKPKQKKKRIKSTRTESKIDTYNHIPVDNCLFIGNGLNRTLETSVAWGSLLKAIAEEYHVTYEPDNPMPIEFERIINAYLASDHHPPKVHHTYTYTK